MPLVTTLREAIPENLDKAKMSNGPRGSCQQRGKRKRAEI